MQRRFRWAIMKCAQKNLGFVLKKGPGISLVVGQRETVDLVLQVGDVRQTVQVEATPNGVSRHNRRCFGSGWRTASERASSQWPQLRSTDDAQPWSCELHLTAGRRNRHFEFGGRQHVCGFRPAPARKSLSAEWRGVHERIRNQQHTGRSERATLGSRCGARIFSRERHLWRGVREASRSPGEYCDRFGNESIARRRLRIPAEQRAGREELF